MTDAPPSGAWRAEAKATLVLGLPLVGSQLAHIAQTSTDVLMMGWVGPETLAAGALGFNVYVTLFVFVMGVAYAAGGPMAQALGARRPGEIGYLLPQSLIVTTIVALPLALSPSVMKMVLSFAFSSMVSFSFPVGSSL